jgi:D-serine deaminase-like pyridoxal phosphate-dependent protein
MQPDVATPAVLIDERRMRANVERMQSLADRHGLSLRPHVKTHKSLELARIQSDAGAFGFTASKPAEAEVFLRGGVGSLTVAYPLLDVETIGQLLDAAGGADLRLVVDSAEGIAAASAAARRRSARLPVFIEIDVGLRRCGVTPTASLLCPLARAVDRDPGLTLAGILSHAGHAYAAPGLDAVRAIATDELALVRHARQLIEHDGIAVETVSIGATPTVLASAAFDGVDEIRPGNYIFLDAMQVALGVARREEVALSVLTTIVARNDEYYIVDAGSKTLSSDKGAHGSEGVRGFGEAYEASDEDSIRRAFGEAPQYAVARLSEEHGFVERAGTDLAIGTRLRITPNHACPVVNLAERMYLVGDDDVRVITVDARGRVEGALRRR